MTARERPAGSDGPLAQLIVALQTLPGIGARSAQRLAHHLLQMDSERLRDLLDAIEQARAHLRACERCNTWSLTPVCDTCSDGSRDRKQLCVVEQPADQISLESSKTYRGLYYVLMGRLNPIEGRGPRDLQFARLLNRALEPEVEEVILATSFTAEGEATAHYLGELLKARGKAVSRLARGVPIGSELEYLDAGTLAYALLDRRPG